MPSSDQHNCAANNPAQLDQRDRNARIRQLNDQLRTSLSGRVMLTSGVQAVGPVALPHILDAVRQHDQFDPGNDPYGEHDFGSVEWQQHKLFWKIDYYDLSLETGSPDPAEAAVTTRVLTIMLASEY